MRRIVAAFGLALLATCGFAQNQSGEPVTTTVTQDRTQSATVTVHNHAKSDLVAFLYIYTLQRDPNGGTNYATANAGSGKTTLVADFLRKQERPYLWYQLDHTDADPAVFLGYLAYGIQQRVPDFGEAIFAYLQQSQELAQEPEARLDQVRGRDDVVVQRQHVRALRAPDADVPAQGDIAVADRVLAAAEAE